VTQIIFECIIWLKIQTRLLWGTYRKFFFLNSKYKCKKTVVYHLVNGCTVLLHTENSKSDRLKVTLLCSTLTLSQTATSNITFNLSFLLFSGDKLQFLPRDALRAKHGLAIICRLSVSPFIRLSVCDVGGS